MLSKCLNQVGMRHNRSWAHAPLVLLLSGPPMHQAPVHTRRR